ncbi:DUF1800 family protein [Paracoccus aerodenitrificans]|nr:DUF1800 family protein [Paracoccus aerodenitrificans]WBU65736.1 DUF1800 family protein [Paracoccus aerodenitrificans]
MLTRYPLFTTESAGAIFREYQLGRRDERQGEESGRQRRINAQLAFENAMTNSLAQRFARALDDETGFADRLAQFWSSHFSIRRGGSRSSILMASFLDTAIRGNQTTTFRQLLKAATLHPAMLIYLDQSSSIGPRSQVGRRQPGRGLNENHARELLELHTLGVTSDYSQNDIRQLAELMTGLQLTPQSLTEFNTKKVEPGAETVLGIEYGGGRPPRLAEFEAFLDDLAVHRDTAAHISRKLAIHFCADDPPDQLISDLTGTFLRTDGDLMSVYQQLVGHDLAKQTFGQKVRQPQDLVTAGLRVLGASGATVMGWSRRELNRAVLAPLKGMGQSWEGALQPEGWPEREGVWLTPQFLAARIGWAMRQPTRLVKPLPDPRDLVRTAFGSALDDELALAASRAESAADGVGVILASPQFNRR